MMQPKQKTIIPPEGGWKAHHMYLVDVSWNPHNPLHRAILVIGFMNGKDGGPGAYSEIWSNSYDGTGYRFHEAHYVKVVRELGPMCDDGKNYQTYPQE